MSEKPEMNLDEMPDPMMEFIDRKMLQDQKRPSGFSLFFKGVLNVLTLGIFRNRLFPKNDLSEYYNSELEQKDKQPIVQNAEEKPVVEKTAEPIKEEKVIAEKPADSQENEKSSKEDKLEEKKSEEENSEEKKVEEKKVEVEKVEEKKVEEEKVEESEEGMQK